MTRQHKEIKQAWDKIRPLDPGSAPEEIWGEAGKVAYPAAAAVMAKRSPTGMKIDGTVGKRLKDYWGDLVDRVTIHWSTPTLDEWAAARFGVRVTDVDTEAQTFGYDIYTRWAKGDQSDAYMFSLLSHELMHVRQYEEHGKSLSRFGYHYFKAYKKAGLNYENNAMEKRAYNETPQVVCLENKFKVGKFVDVDGARKTLMPLQPYIAESGCDWIKDSRGGGHYSFENWALPGLVLDIDGATGKLMLAKYTPGGGCDWLLRDRGNGYFSLENKFLSGRGKAKRFLDIDGRNGKLMLEPYTTPGCDWRVR